MMKQIGILLLLFSYSLSADIAVIGHLESGLSAMTQKEVKEIFMGRLKSLPNGSFALPVDQYELRARFYFALTERPIEQINAYWARIMFSGKASPPMKLPHSEAIIKVVTENKGAIGYVDQKNVDESRVKVLLLLKAADEI